MYPCTLEKPAVVVTLDEGPDHRSGLLEGAEEKRPRAWLLKITRNMASDVLKTAGHRRLLRRENGDEIRENLFPQPDEGGERDRRVDQVLEAAPTVLTKRQLQVLRCR